MAEENQNPATEEETTVVSKLTGAIGGYFDAVIEQPLQHGISMLIGAGVDRRMVTSAAKSELSDQAYAKLRSKIVLGGLPLINA